MINKGRGGGNTITGLNFERGRDIVSFVKKLGGYSVKGNIIYFKNKEVARSYKKYGLYIYLKSQGVDYKKFISKKLLPDEAVYVICNNTFLLLR